MTRFQRGLRSAEDLTHLTPSLRPVLLDQTTPSQIARTPRPADAPFTETLPALTRERVISHLLNLAAGRELPNRRALERAVGFATAYRIYQMIRR